MNPVSRSPSPTQSQHGAMYYMVSPSERPSILLRATQEPSQELAPQVYSDGLDSNGIGRQPSDPNWMGGQYSQDHTYSVPSTGSYDPNWVPGDGLLFNWLKIHILDKTHILEMFLFGTPCLRLVLMFLCLK